MHVSFKCDFEKRAEKKTERDSRFCYQNIKPNNVEKKRRLKRKIYKNKEEENNLVFQNSGG